MASREKSSEARAAGSGEEIEVRGHIVDSLLLPKILDRILQMGGTFEIRECRIGVQRSDPSYARIGIRADTPEAVAEIIGDLVEHGASPVHPEDVRTVPADVAAAFPENFYSTTNQRTQVRVKGRWIDVEDQEMDCGVALDAAAGRARCIPMVHVELGMPIVVGHAGVRVLPEERSRETSLFGFMSSNVSSEKPKAVSLQGVADSIRATRADGKKVLLVGGPAIVHTGSAPHVARLIREGWIQTLFAGNALATHDIEQSLYGTSLGVSIAKGEAIEHGHEHHLRAINAIRRLGGIRAAVDQGVVTSGIMYECVKQGVDFVLAGSIRDDGPLPDVVTDVLVAQDRMRASVRDVGFALCIATALHSIATGNLLPAWVKVVCVDINPATVTKLADRGSFQTIGIVTDVEPFLRSLAAELTAGGAETGPGA
ncbi:TIGR00300 family protein [Paludisphaera mucosa]|uniref:ornithine cyclodeaminase n=1 Tax=Paludisphaera mucosa TaxID=3030827 RepID=A0ABT6FDW6_9BACT|nr:TIGR00300 family protein [Paludisphaera mucosa]MDG3005763.1 TIGR00300 family protein [Paludisphaera mucosa]